MGETSIGRRHADGLRETREASTLMSGLIAVMLGSVLGGAARYFVSGMVARQVGETFPWGTLLINVSGALVIGVCGGLAKDSASILAQPDIWLFAVTGVLGCYTTVSSFSLQTLSLAKDNQMPRALGYVVLSVALSLAAAAAGFALVDVMK
ncbi:MAG: fluoride efflux transporter CrcB [Bradyrhizobium sp.]|nr:fluoride efflux transporter CrcB [Bradyrhizobium sp.]